MNFVKQPTFETCGQACIAMLADRDINDVIKDMGTGGPTSIGQLIDILDQYGIRHAEKNTRISRKTKNPLPARFLRFIRRRAIPIGCCISTESIMIRNAV